jgi:hypothetical protein
VLEAFLEPAEAVGFVETRDIIEARGKLMPAFPVEFEPRKLRRRDARAFAELFQSHWTPRESEHRKFMRRDFLSARTQIVERGQQLAFRKVAGGAKDNDGARRRGLGLGNLNRFSQRMNPPLKECGCRQA